MKKLLTFSMLCYSATSMCPINNSLHIATQVLGKSRQEIKKLYTFSPSEVTHISQKIEDNYIKYSGTLQNGDTVNAQLFTEGPSRGMCDCFRNTNSTDGKGSLMLNLEKKYFRILHNLYTIFKR